MATNLPGALDDGTTLILTMVATTPQSNPSHSLQTVNVNGATQQIENALASATNKLYRSNGATVLGTYSSTVTVNDSTGVLDITLSQAAVTKVSATNSNGGAGAAATLRASNGTITADVNAYGAAFGGSVFGLANNNSMAAFVSNATLGVLYGATGNGPVMFGTNNVERMRILAAGNVGIAQSIPAYTLDVTGTGRYTSTLNVTSSLGTAVFALDSSINSTLTIANNATATPCGNANNFSGIIIIDDTNVTGQSAIFLIGSGSVLVSQTGTIYTATASAPALVSVYLSAGVVTVENKSGSSINFSIMMLRVRASS